MMKEHPADFRAKMAQWMRDRKEAGDTEKSIQTRYMVLRSFAKYNECPIKDRTKKIKPAKRTVVSKADLKKLVSVATPKIKAILLMLRDSGLGPSDLLTLKYRDVRRPLENEDVPITLNMVRSKTGEQLTTFLGPESIEALKAWIAYREQRIKRKLTDKDFLFTAWIIKDTPQTYVDLVGCIEALREKAGVADFQLYDLRRYFITQLSAAGANALMVELMVGHSTGVNHGYMLPTEDQLREEYIKHYDALAFSEEVTKKAQAIVDSKTSELFKTMTSLSTDKLKLESEVKQLQEAGNKTKAENDEFRERFTRWEQHMKTFLGMSPEQFSQLIKAMQEQQLKEIREADSAPPPLTDEKLDEIQEQEQLSARSKRKKV